MNDLITRLERADGPDRELDVEIAKRFSKPTRNGAINISSRYTASIDAALTLVPEGWGWTAARYWCEGENAPPYYADCVNLSDAINGADTPVFEAKCATPALALCIAALRAHQKDTNA